MAIFSGASFGGSSLGSSGGGGFNPNTSAGPFGYRQGAFAPGIFDPRVGLASPFPGRPQMVPAAEPEIDPLFMPGPEPVDRPRGLMTGDVNYSEGDAGPEVDDFVEGRSDALKIHSSVPNPKQGDGLTAEQRAEALVGDQKQQDVRRNFAEGIDEFRSKEQSAEEALDMMGTARQRGQLRQIERRDRPFAQMDRMFLALGGGLAGPEERAGRGAYAQQSQRGTEFGYQGAVQRVERHAALLAEVQQAAALEDELNSSRMARKALALDAERFEQMAPEEKAALLEQFETDRQKATAKAQADQVQGNLSGLREENSLLGQELEALRRELKDAEENGDDEAVEAISQQIAETEARRRELRGELLEGGKESRKPMRGAAKQAVGEGMNRGATLRALKAKYPELSDEEIEALIEEELAGAEA